ncbi:MAG: TonB family protein [Prevotella sp.]|nr:TonB family protein [Prevotella sp.]
MKRITLLIAALLITIASFAQVGRFKNIPTLYSGYSLKLDTATGALSAVHYDNATGDVSEEVISAKKSSDVKQVGRYEFRRTEYIGTYVIFDSATGKYTNVKWQPKRKESTDGAESAKPAKPEEVVKSESPKEPTLDPRAAFPGLNGDVEVPSANTTAAEKEEKIIAGQSSGHSSVQGASEGHANAKLNGRTVMGAMPRPAYNGTAEGTVVVKIKVDQYGNVTEALPGAEGTTVTDKELWRAARNAAIKAHFNMSSDAPAVQEGTITYRFSLK